MITNVVGADEAHSAGTVKVRNFRTPTNFSVNIIEFKLRSSSME